MSQSTTQIYLVAGATRGIGLALVEAIASKDATAIIYAGARDPSGASQLKALSAKYPGRIEIVKYVAGDKEGNDALAKAIGAKHGRIDTVIANAGIANYMAKTHEVPAEKFTEHFDVNVLGPIVLFQSVYDLLKASPLPRFVPISSGAGSIEGIQPASMDIAPYGTSKAALNWVTRKIHFENEWLITYPQCPGAVDTDMAQQVFKADNDGELTKYLKSIMRPANVAAEMVLDIIIGSTREGDGGQYHKVEGGRYPW